MDEPAVELLEGQIMLNAARIIEQETFEALVKAADSGADNVLIAGEQITFALASSHVEEIKARMARMRKVGK